MARNSGVLLLCTCVCVCWSVIVIATWLQWARKCTEKKTNKQKLRFFN